MEISAGAEQLDVNRQLQILMEQALSMPEARDEISSKRFRIDVVGQSCTLPIGDDPEAVVVGREFASPGVPEATYVKARLDPDGKKDAGNYFEVRYVGGGGPNVHIINGRLAYRTVFSKHEKDMRLQLAMLTLDEAVTGANSRRGQEQDQLLPEPRWKDEAGRLRKLGRAIMRPFKRQ